MHVVRTAKVDRLPAMWTAELNWRRSCVGRGLVLRREWIRLEATAAVWALLRQQIDRLILQNLKGAGKPYYGVSEAKKADTEVAHSFHQ